MLDIEFDSTKCFHQTRRVTVWGLVANLALAAGKFMIGIFVGSQALIADGVHSLSDTATDVAVLIGASFWTAPADETHPHGHQRIETIVALAIGASLAGVGVLLAYRAIGSIAAPHGRPSWAVFAAASLSIIAKEALYQWTARVGKRVRSAALMANAWHHRSDAMSSVPVAIAAIAMRLERSWTFLDHVAALVVSVLILQAAWKIFWPAARQLTDTGATKEQLARLKALATSTQGVKTLHAMRTRHIGAGLQVDLHVMVDPDISVRDGHSVARVVEQRLLHEGPDVVDVLVHLEPYEQGETSGAGPASDQSSNQA